MRPSHLRPLVVASASLITLVAFNAWSQPSNQPGNTDTPKGDAPKTDPSGPGAGPTGDAPKDGAKDPPKKDASDARPSTPLPSDITRQSDFLDTRLTWTFGDDDVTKATGEAQPISPNVSVGDRSQYRLFFDNLNSRFAGRENLTHLVLYKKLPGYIEGLTTEAAIVLRFDLAQLASQSNNVNSALYDSGSYLRIFYKTGAIDEKRDAGIDLTLFPLDTDRFRLGYLYDISWGGTAANINQSIFPRLVGQAPGAKLQYIGRKFYTFVGFKTAQIVQVQASVASEALDVTHVQQTNFGVLGGGGVDFTDNFRLDVGAGFFQQGRQETTDVLGEPVYTYGASARLVVHDKMPVPASVDFALYRNDPNSPFVAFRKEQYVEGQLSWSVALEGTRLHQNLRDFDRPGTTSEQPAHAAAFSAVVKYGYLRVSGAGIYRDLAFVLRNQPGYIPFTTMPKDAKLTPEAFFSLAADYHIPSLHLTPGIGGGMQLPATFGSQSTDLFGANIGTTVAVRQQGNISILPTGDSSQPIIQSRASLRLDLSDMMSTVFWSQVVYDNNATRLENSDDGTTYLRKYVSPLFLGFGMYAQARF